jgi:hypothetical protein
MLQGASKPLLLLLLTLAAFTPSASVFLPIAIVMQLSRHAQRSQQAAASAAPADLPSTPCHVGNLCAAVLSTLSYSALPCAVFCCAALTT